MNNTPYQMPNIMPYMDSNSYSPSNELKRGLEQIERELEFIEKRLTNIENILKEKNNIYASNVTNNQKGLYMI